MITHVLRIFNTHLHFSMYFYISYNFWGDILDIMLDRILSLIPHKPDGKFVHGSVKEFATGLGLKSGNIVSDWIAGRSKSYESYLYQIAAKYDVSVEWLRGETDEKKPTVSDSGADKSDLEFLAAFKAAPEYKRDAIKDLLGLK